MGHGVRTVDRKVCVTMSSRLTTWPPGLKKGGTPVNAQVIIEENFAELEEAKNKRYVNKKQGDGTNHMMDRVVVPSD